LTWSNTAAQGRSGLLANCPNPGGKNIVGPVMAAFDAATLCPRQACPLLSIRRD
jgi:hypothetical protein